MPNSSAVVVRAEGLGKQYRIGSRVVYRTLRDAVARMATAPFHRLGGWLRPGREKARDPQTIWALRNFDLEIRQGEALGVIGRNGAGKTTLLKILSRITEPTVGRVELRGRVGSLLEVGTGFHPELTGRENIVLNGAILGMRRAEIHRRFDEIVAFAQIEEFLDTPVKRYSSGMYVRLAFAVAAHLEPEILLVDEVLAVGDLAFQRRCLGKMEEVARGGRTVVFVSHNLAAVENFCSRGVLVEGGRKYFDGPVSEAVSEYLKLQENRLSKGLGPESFRTGSGKIVFSSFSVESPDGCSLTFARSGHDVVLVLGYKNNSGKTLEDVDVSFSIHTASGQDLTVLYSSYVGTLFTIDKTEGHFRCLISRLPLVPGRYRIAGRILIRGEEADWPRDGLGFLEVESGDFYGTGHRGFDGAAPVMIDGQWFAR